LVPLSHNLSGTCRSYGYCPLVVGACMWSNRLYLFQMTVDDECVWPDPGCVPMCL
jgi:hypothetical protein